ncbi:hypothetical protein [Pseudonocardia alni]|uniref:hypothetical protein n=1 Tax=Pseudonocardia alni TaxID=33907 RepID=UPI0033289E61
MQTQRERTDSLFAGGRFLLPAQVHEQVVPDVDELFDYSLARHLDGFAVLVGEPPSSDSRSAP